MAESHDRLLRIAHFSPPTRTTGSQDESTTVFVNRTLGRLDRPMYLQSHSNLRYWPDNMVRGKCVLIRRTNLSALQCSRQTDLKWRGIGHG